MKVPNERMILLSESECPIRNPLNPSVPDEVPLLVLRGAIWTVGGISYGLKPNFEVQKVVQKGLCTATPMQFAACNFFRAFSDTL
jgi:hypothetical protein